MFDYKNREIFNEIIDYLEIPEIIVVHGARQVGKTTLMRMIINYLNQKNIKNVFYFDLEQDKYLELCNKGYDETAKYIKQRKADQNSKTFIFIDEIQYLDNPSSFLKLFYDHGKNDYKLIISGSSSFAIKQKFKDSLVGRIIDIEMFGLSFKEFLDFKNLKYNLMNELSSDLADEELKNFYQEYILYGSYPQVVLADNIKLKETYLNNIIKRYVYKDVKDLAHVREIGKFNNLLQCIASQAGQLVNIKELSNTLNISHKTVEDYLFILENLYIVKLIRPFYKNIRSELTKMPKVYFEDLGILNILKNKELMDNFDGNFFENAVYTYLRYKFNINNLHYWRTIAKQEVDFIIDGRKLIPAEIKMSYSDKTIKNLIYFGEKYKINDLYCVTLNKNENSRFKKIKQIYPWEIEKLG